jgi:hypothetical protein
MRGLLTSCSPHAENRGREPAMPRPRLNQHDRARAAACALLLSLAIGHARAASLTTSEPSSAPGSSRFT